MADKLKFLAIADDAQVGRWLQLSVEAQRNDCSFTLDNRSTLDHRLATTGTTEFDLMFAVLDFSPEAAASSLGWLEQMLGMPGTPPLVVLAEGGGELSAVEVMRSGAVDYLPRRALNMELLAATIERGLAARCLPPAPEVAPMHNLLDVPSDLIPRYTLLDKLGESPRATVFLAHSAALDLNVALKVSRILDRDEAQFSREFVTVGGLSHPGIVEIYDYGVHADREFIAMEYFPGGDMRTRMQKRLSEREAVDFLQLIAAALSAVHRHGILHRDLKPPNIMLRDDGQIVLIDFGISKQMGQLTRSTAAGVLRGSPYYMSPEQAQGLDLDVRSDLYSLGVIFYEMLTGNRPYPGVTAIEVLQQHVSAPVPELPPELSEYQSLLEGMMAKSPDDRFATADALLASLLYAAA